LSTASFSVLMGLFVATSGMSSHSIVTLLLNLLTDPHEIVSGSFGVSDIIEQTSVFQPLEGYYPGCSISPLNRPALLTINGKLASSFWYSVATRISSSKSETISDNA
jgi:hypothetical protein